MSDELLCALLERIALGIEGLRADLARERAARPLFDRLAEAVFALLRDERFDAARLLDLADQNISSRAPLAAALDEIVRDRRASGAGRRLGIFLKRHAGAVTVDAEFRLQHLNDSRAGTVYRLVRVAGVADDSRGVHPWKL